jgi:8-oxo-dGTP diphosphatase
MDTGLHVIDIVFLCHHQSGEAFPKIPDEVDEIVCMTTPKVLTHTELPDYLRENIKLADKVLKELSSSQF